MKARAEISEIQTNESKKKRFDFLEMINNIDNSLNQINQKRKNT